MLQSLSDPLFAVPFLSALGGGLLGVVVGTGYGWLFRRRAESRTERLSARVGGVGLAGIGVASVAFGFDYAGTQARLLDGTGVEPSVLGRIGRSFPWDVAAAAVGVGALVCVFVAMGLSIHAKRSTADAEN
ncbi:hypothetical protein [Haloarcula marina]|uniref:hypothetical protein n=1 Tax=Haloarcula marina TaxID=2961574 RepID=UPI0020B6E2F0|nr:hypothetical protein [Halomicroarcula marina]